MDQIYKILDLHNLSTARYYDLLSRSFEFEVKGHYLVDETIFYHPVTWGPITSTPSELLNAPNLAYESELQSN